MKRKLKIAASVVLGLFIAVNCLCMWQAYVYTHFLPQKHAKRKIKESFIARKAIKIFGKEQPRQLVVDSLTVPHQSLTIQSDGLKLAAWYLQHNTDSSIKGTVVMFHGYSSSRSEIIPEASAFYKMHYNVLMIDFRAHGQSEGSTCTMGYKEADDVKAAYKFVKQTGKKNIVLWGGSMGAAAITKAMYDDDSIQPQKIILEKSFGTMQDAVEGLVRNTLHEKPEPLASVLTFWGSVEQGIWMFKMTPENFVTKIHCPALIQWGTLDEHVSKEETESIFKNLGSTKKQLVIYPNCKHENLLLKRPDIWLKNVGNFLS